MVKQWDLVVRGLFFLHFVLGKPKDHLLVPSDESIPSSGFPWILEVCRCYMNVVGFVQETNSTWLTHFILLCHKLCMPIVDSLCRASERASELLSFFRYECCHSTSYAFRSRFRSAFRQCIWKNYEAEVFAEENAETYYVRNDIIA